jgi:hypothetical protein
MPDGQIASWIATFGLALTSPFTRAEGHGPAFGLATPTLAREQWSSDIAAMRFEDDTGASTQFRQLLSYGITEDLQANLAFPLGRTGDSAIQPTTRGASMMGAAETVEASLQWRFQRSASGIGRRRESALLFGVSEPTRRTRGGIEPGTGFNLAAVTGYVSRTTYGWLGGGVQGTAARDGAKLGNVYYATAVLGWRPPLFRADYPKPDWRLFVEGLCEKRERHRLDGKSIADSGGKAAWLGPSVLGLYGQWGVEGGIIWPVSQMLHGSQPEAGYRAKLVLTYWF